MYVKLVNPRSGQVQTFQCDKEAAYEPQGVLSIDEQRRWENRLQDDGYDTRKFVLRPSSEGEPDEESPAVVEILIPLPQHKQIAVLTNWDAYLVNDQGRTIDRIFRYVEPVPA